MHQVPELEGVRATIALEDLSSSGSDDARDRVQQGATLAARCAVLYTQPDSLHRAQRHVTDFALALPARTSMELASVHEHSFYVALPLVL